MAPAINRRDFLNLIAVPAWAGMASRLVAQVPDIILRIAPIEMEIAAQRRIKTIGYNGSAPGPLLRCREGDTLTVEVHNDTSTSELVHWHGLHISRPWTVPTRKARPWSTRTVCSATRSSRVPRALGGTTPTDSPAAT